MEQHQPMERGISERAPLFVHQTADGGSSPCVLIHGFGEGAYVWTDLVRHLPPDYRAFAVDLRGHGYSPRSADGQYLVRLHMADVVETLDRLALERVVLIGHSMGGDIAMRIAIAQPARVAALVIVDVGIEPRHEVVFSTNLALYRSLRAYPSIDEYLATLVRKRPLAPLDLLRHCATEALEGTPESGFRLRLDPKFFTPANHPRNDTRLDWDMYARIACPTLLVRGAVSAVLPKSVAARLAAAIPGCSLHEIQGAGHTPMLENPAAFRAEVNGFLDGIRDRL